MTTVIVQAFLPRLAGVFLHLAASLRNLVKALETARAFGEELCQLELRKKAAVKKEDYEDAARAKKVGLILSSLKNARTV